MAAPLAESRGRSSSRRARSKSCATSRSVCATLRLPKTLSISEQTVKTHLNTIFRKLGVRDRVELTLYAARAGIISVKERSS